VLCLGSVTTVPDPAGRAPDGEIAGAGHLLLAVSIPFQQSQEPNEGEYRDPHPNKVCLESGWSFESRASGAGKRVLCCGFTPDRIGRES